MRDEVFVVDQAGKARIVAGKNRTNGQIVFPYPDGEGEGAYERIELPQSGTLWTFTIQRIPPKNPPYVGVTNPDDYEPYGVGYVSLGDEIMIEGRLVADPESRSEEHTSELQSLMRISYSVFCLKTTK